MDRRPSAAAASMPPTALAEGSTADTLRCERRHASDVCALPSWRLLYVDGLSGEVGVRAPEPLGLLTRHHFQFENGAASHSRNKGMLQFNCSTSDAQRRQARALPATIQFAHLAVSFMIVERWPTFPFQSVLVRHSRHLLRSISRRKQAAQNRKSAVTDEEGC